MLCSRSELKSGAQDFTSLRAALISGTGQQKSSSVEGWVSRVTWLVRPGCRDGSGVAEIRVCRVSGRGVWGRVAWLNSGSRLLRIAFKRIRSSAV